VKPDATLLKSGFAAIGNTFRGSIWENARRFRLVGKAYDALPKEQDGFFDIASARHLTGPLLALQDPNVREVGLIAGTQTLKSVGGDIWTPYIIEHVGRNMAIYFEDDKKAQEFCDARLMMTIRNHPVIKTMLKEVDRHEITKTKIIVAGVTIHVMGLNDGNTSTLSWPIIWISESWQHKSDGLLKKARERSDRFPNDKKIYIESRAGLADEDLDRCCKEMVRVDLTWACPFCHGMNKWDFSQTRPEDFKPDCDRFNGFASPKPLTYCGMTIPKEGTIEERARNSTWECYHCGTQIRDTRENRQRIMDSYRQDYKINGISPKKVCFYNPKEAARDNSFEQSVLSFLTAKHAERMGNMTPMEDWYMSERAVFYDKSLSQPKFVTSIGSHDPNSIIENEHSRGLIIDVQKIETDGVDQPGTFWYEVYIANKSGDSFQMDRGFLSSKEKSADGKEITGWEKLREIQKKWKIPNHYVCVDCRKWTPVILDNMAQFYEMVQGIHPYTRRPIMYAQCWRAFMGDQARNFPHPDKTWKSYSVGHPKLINLDKDGKRVTVPVVIYRWSNSTIKERLFNLRIGGEGMPKLVPARREMLSPQTQAKEVGDYTYDQQLNSEWRTQKNGKDIWDKINSNRPNHYLDLVCMRLVRMDMDGLATYSIGA
jgi:hypothetical protein